MEMRKNTESYEMLQGPWAMCAGGASLATEKLNLYPLFFEDWVYRLMKKAQEASTDPADPSQ